MKRVRGRPGIAVASAFVALCAQASASASPAIRTSATNSVPACVTPDRLTAFLRSRNANPDARYSSIAAVYRRHGETWRVRWDYAFFQMALETNFLTYRRGDGRPGDVSPRQNNFAGLGATGGGVPGDSYPDVATGVLAQIHHLVVYSGERIERPAGTRTQLKQDDIIAVSRRLNRAVTFADLTNRWAADRKYHQSIEAIAAEYRDQYCSGDQAKVVASPPQPAFETLRSDGTAASPQLASRAALGAPGVPPPSRARPPAGATAAPVAMPCRVLSASYGGTSAVLIKSEAGGEVQYTALQVLDGFERSMARNYVATQATGGTAVGTFPSRDAALARARELCPDR